MSYNYVHTTGSIIEQGLDKQLLRPFVKKYLYSIFNLFGTGTGFGYDSIDVNGYKIKKFYDGLYPDESLFIDSGGYSIITGDIPYRYITKFLECYLYFIEKHFKNFNQIISLDIPIFLNDQKYNTKENIKQLNYQSNIETKKILDNNKLLYEKFIFVWHFKIKEQQKIFNNLYNDIWKDSLLKHHAIGGLVSLRKIANIKFSPFIGPAFKVCKIIEQQKSKGTSILHILGVYHRYDRFCMLFLDKLFNQIYLKNQTDKNINITFDTINYTITALYKIRELPIFEFIKDEKTLHKFIPNKIVFNLINKDINNIKNGKQITHPKLYSLLHVVYEYIIDTIMNNAIKKYNILELFLNNNSNVFRTKLKLLLYNLQNIYPNIFNNSIIIGILNSFSYICSFHNAYIDNADINRLDKGISLFAKDINFPVNLL